jgi:hypothetical protein
MPSPSPKAHSADGMLDAQLLSQVEDQRRQAVRQFAPPAKGRVALFVGVECDHVGRESAGRRATRDPPGIGLGGVVENVKAVHA